LHNNEIGPEGATAMAKALEVNGVLTSLNVGYNQLTEEAALSIVRVEQQRNKLTSLGLGNCKIGPIGAKEIAEWISVSRVLTELKLWGNDIGSLGALAIAEALKVNGVLTNLSVAYNVIEGEAAQQLAAAVHASASLQIFSEVPLNKLRADSLTELDLPQKGLGTTEAIVIAELVKVSRVLTSLDVGYNQLTEEAALSIVRVEQQRNKLASLGLDNCQIGPMGAKEIAEWISVSRVLTTLNLSGPFQNIGDQGAAAIAEALKVNGVLTNLE